MVMEKLTPEDIMVRVIIREVAVVRAPEQW
jgi:hypothetical protein